MPNLVEAIRNRIQAQHPGALLIERGEQHVRYLLETLPDGRQHFATVSSTGVLHYHDGSDWQETDTNFADSAETGFTDEVTTASLIVRGDGNSRKRLYPRRDRLGEYAEFARLQAESGVSFANVPWSSRQRSANAVTFDRANASLTLKHLGRSVEVLITLKDPSAATSPNTMRCRWPVSLVGLHRVGWQLVSDADSTIVATIRPPVITHAGNVELKTPRPVQCEVTGGAVEFTADLTALAYPIVIDPTIAVGASTDDAAQEVDGPTNVASASYFLENGGAGAGLYDLFGARWPITGPASGDTVNTAYVELYASDAADLDFDIDFQAADTAAAFSTGNNDISGRALTGSSVAWAVTGTNEAYNQSPSVVAPLQAVISRAGWASGNYVVAVFNHNSADRCQLRTYDGSSTLYPAKLTIEYTAAGAPTVVASRRSLLGVGV